MVDKELVVNDGRKEGYIQNKESGLIRREAKQKYNEIVLRPIEERLNRMNTVEGMEMVLERNGRQKPHH